MLVEHVLKGIIYLFIYFGLVMVSRIKEIDNYILLLSPASPKQQIEVN